MTFVQKRYQMRTHQNGTQNMSSGFFVLRGLAHEDCNAAPGLECQKLKLFLWAVQIKNQTLGWVARPIDPEAVFPKEYELVEVCGLFTHAPGLAHGAAVEPHVAYALH